MTRTTIVRSMALAALFLAGCSFHARDPESYRKVTRDVLETRNPEIKACYDKELEKDPKLSGTVVVKFVVEKDTGLIKGFEVDKKASDASKDLRSCVLGALEGKDLRIDPPDAREGHATFRYEFKAGKG